MKSNKWLWIIGIIFTMSLSGCGGGFGGKSECKELIQDFEEACNELDVQGILNCIDPKVSDPIKTVVAIGGIVTDNVDQYLEDIMSGIGKELTDAVGSNGTTEDVLASIQLEPKKYSLKQKEGTVRCVAIFEVNGMDITKTLNISVVKKNDEWYVSGISIVE